MNYLTNIFLSSLSGALQSLFAALFIYFFGLGGSGSTTTTT